MLEARTVTRTFNGNRVLRGVNLDIHSGEIVCLLGPSGCGKTTLLRIIAGLETADSGDVLLNGESILPVPVHARDFGLMFQDFALFPHLNVADNVKFGLKMRGQSRHLQEQRVSDVLELVGLSGFEQRDVAELSGGEKQRVALARSLAPNPRLLMLDEPLGSLDAALRERLLVDLRKIIKASGLTALYVTHDQAEAFAIADRIAVMNAGRIEQIATPETLYRYPTTVFVAYFLGLNNVVPILERIDGRAHTPLGDLLTEKLKPFDADDQIQAILLHPNGVHMTTEGGIPLQVVECIYRGDVYRIKAEHPSGIIFTFDLPITTHPPAIGQDIMIDAAPEWVIGLQA